MKSRFLFSHKFKIWGWILLIIGLVLGTILMFNDFDYPDWEAKVFPLVSEDGLLAKNKAFQWSYNNIADEIASVLIIVGGVLVAFSKTKDEDEFIARIRMESLIWATYVNYIVLLVAILFVFDMAFFNVMICNMFTILLFFIVRFHYILYKTKKGISYEE